MEVPGVAFQLLVRPHPDPLSMFGRNAEHRGDDLDREQRREIGDHIERGAIEGAGDLVDLLPNHRFQRGDRAGVNTLLTSLRITVCSGGSIMMTSFGCVGSGSARYMSRVMPLADE